MERDWSFIGNSYLPHAGEHNLLSDEFLSALTIYHTSLVAHIPSSPVPVTAFDDSLIFLIVFVSYLTAHLTIKLNYFKLNIVFITHIIILICHKKIRAQFDHKLNKDISLRKHFSLTHSIYIVVGFL